MISRERFLNHCHWETPLAHKWPPCHTDFISCCRRLECFLIFNLASLYTHIAATPPIPPFRLHPDIIVFKVYFPTPSVYRLIFGCKSTKLASCHHLDVYYTRTPDTTGFLTDFPTRYLTDSLITDDDDFFNVFWYSFDKHQCINI